MQATLQNLLKKYMISLLKLPCSNKPLRFKCQLMGDYNKLYVVTARKMKNNSIWSNTLDNKNLLFRENSIAIDFTMAEVLINA